MPTIHDLTAARQPLCGHCSLMLSPSSSTLQPPSSSASIYLHCVENDPVSWRLHHHHPQLSIYFVFRFPLFTTLLQIFDTLSTACWISTDSMTLLVSPTITTPSFLVYYKRRRTSVIEMSCLKVSISVSICYYLYCLPRGYIHSLGKWR